MDDEEICSSKRSSKKSNKVGPRKKKNKETKKKTKYAGVFFVSSSHYCRLLVS